MTLCGGSFLFALNYLLCPWPTVDGAILILIRTSQCDLDRRQEITIIAVMTFAAATPADIEELVRFVNNAYRGESAEAGWASEGKLMAGQRIDSAMLAEMLSIQSGTILLMRDQMGGPLAGCVSLKLTDEPSTWYLSMLAIDPQRQAEGLGRLLLAEAEDRSKARGGTQVKITVIWLRQTLIEWYERRGYRLTGQTEPFPYDDQRFGVPLRNDLYFVELAKRLGSGL